MALFKPLSKKISIICGSVSMVYNNLFSFALCPTPHIICQGLIVRLVNFGWMPEVVHETVETLNTVVFCGEGLALFSVRWNRGGHLNLVMAWVVS